MKHNIYFDGKVQSLSLDTEDGRATIGVISPGKYGFATATEERMVITSGLLKAKLPQQDWAAFKAGQEFIVGENLSFEVEAEKDVSYICYYK
jgi:purine/pyrimidine-nucleoside phosphorylase